jgi:hypothetical protein
MVLYTNIGINIVELHNAISKYTYYISRISESDVHMYNSDKQRAITRSRDHSLLLFLAVNKR